MYRVTHKVYHLVNQEFSTGVLVPVSQKIDFHIPLNKIEVMMETSLSNRKTFSSRYERYIVNEYQLTLQDRQTVTSISHITLWAAEFTFFLCMDIHKRGNYRIHTVWITYCEWTSTNTAFTVSKAEFTCPLCSSCRAVTGVDTAGLVGTTAADKLFTGVCVPTSSLLAICSLTTRLCFVNSRRSSSCISRGRLFSNDCSNLSIITRCSTLPA